MLGKIKNSAQQIGKSDPHSQLNEQAYSEQAGIFFSLFFRQAFFFLSTLLVQITPQDY